VIFRLAQVFVFWLAEYVTLRLPFYREGLPKSAQLPSRGLSPIKDEFNQLRGEQRETQNFGNVGDVHSFFGRQLFDRAVRPIVEKCLPAKATRKCLHEDIVHIEPGRCGGNSGAIWRDDELTAASPTKCHRNVNREIVFTHYAATF
jgi:hypothetical protein